VPKPYAFDGVSFYSLSRRAASATLCDYVMAKQVVKGKVPKKLSSRVVSPECGSTPERGGRNQPTDASKTREGLDGSKEGEKKDTNIG